MAFKGVSAEPWCDTRPTRKGWCRTEGQLVLFRFHKIRNSFDSQLPKLETDPNTSADLHHNGLKMLALTIGASLYRPCCQAQTLLDQNFNRLCSFLKGQKRDRNMVYGKTLSQLAIFVKMFQLGNESRKYYIKRNKFVRERLKLKNSCKQCRTWIRPFKIGQACSC